MNRRGFLALGIQSAFLAAAISTGLGRVSLALAGTPNLSGMIAETLRRNQRKLAEHVMANNSLFKRLIEVRE